ncbi:MAG TPA: hypothetical protein VG125_32165 [Pirellulales bacterium]|jgi:hypothetical protein|nr:hypothetical protein [Pirellulales bacterium]
MRIKHVETLLAAGPYATSQEWSLLRAQLHDAVSRVDWPSGSGTFTVYPERRGRSGGGNGIGPIKTSLMTQLKKTAWKLSDHLELAVGQPPCRLDAVFYTKQGPFAVEWDTGSLASSHRALNKMALGLVKGILVGGALVVPTRKLYRYLTHEIGNWEQIAPFLDLWRAVPIRNGVLEVIAVEHDVASVRVPKIPTGNAQADPG